MQKLQLAIFFGGKSSEHEVSVISARNVFDALDKSKYDITLIGITRSSAWKQIDPEQLRTIKDVSESEVEYINKSLKGIDVVFPLIHGTTGEDGSLQGYLNFIGKPYVGPGVLGSALGMDKDIAKKLLMIADIPVTLSKTLMKGDALEYAEIVNNLGEPFFVKPANQGSSVGVSKVHNEGEYNEALEKAFNFDNKILIEKFIEGKEIECAVLGNDRPEASVLGEVAPTHEFYDYDAKYIDENGALLILPAVLDTELSKEICEMAVKTFKILQCRGMARVDFFVTTTNEVYVNEINTIPGFTSISMYPRLWQESGVSYPELLDRLIKLAMEYETN